MLIKTWEKAFLPIVVLIAAYSSWIALGALQGAPFELTVNAGATLGDVAFRVDALSAWMILVINFTVLAGSVYGMGYLEPYKKDRANYALHLAMMVVFHASMILVCAAQHFLAFLALWEIMAISSFLLAIMEWSKPGVVRAGLNYLIQSHVGILFLTLGFIWAISSTGSFDFRAITTLTQSAPFRESGILFFLLFIGFGFKAGFVPLHTWLPYAHPAAPSHVSGMMSGVMIKLGIYGILRMLLLFRGDYYTIGIIILIVSVTTALYGVMLAIVQHNLKRLLAYHSIENIGIIGIGIGIGAIGVGLGNSVLSILGFSGALLHTINHSLFKSLLFYGAGSVYTATHTLNVERLGGLGKKMPATAALFLIAALAICGLPPFNGFVSEYLVYSGLFFGVSSPGLAFALTFLLAAVSLVLVGGLAALCFTKAFGIVFLGSPRHKLDAEPREVSKLMLAPQFAIAAVILFIGLFPGYVLKALTGAISLFTPSVYLEPAIYNFYIEALNKVGMISASVLVIFGIIFGLKKLATRNRAIETSPTWSCGYVAPTPKMQYTASSFVKTYSNLIKPILSIHKHETEINTTFPAAQSYESDAYDKSEYYLIDKNLKLIKKLLYKFNFLQNGKTQFYIMYGLIFILLIVLLSYARILGIIPGLNK